MGKENNVLNSYLGDPARFADLFNGVCFNGEPVISPEGLSEASEKYDVHVAENDDGERTEKEERIRDIKKSYDNRMILKILAVENQSHVDYTAGVRNMQYDVMEYTEQVQRLKAKHRLKGDYGMNLICLNEMEDYSLFRTEIGQLFEIMKYRRDKEGLEKLLKDNEKYRHLDADTVEAVSVMLHRPEIWKNRERDMKKNENEREEYDMCQALQEICDEMESVGFSKGMEKGTINSIKALMETMNLTMDKAMDALRIPENKRKYYRKCIK